MYELDSNSFKYLVRNSISLDAYKSTVTSAQHIQEVSLHTRASSILVQTGYHIKMRLAICQDAVFPHFSQLLLWLGYDQDTEVHIGPLRC